MNSEVETLILQSLKEHSEMLAMLKALQREIDTHSVAYLEQFNTNYHTLQQQSQGTDNKLFKQLDLEGISKNIRQQLDHRKSMQQDILDLLKKTVPRANIAKTLMASEIQSIQKGRTALSGYKSQLNNQGKIVNRAS